MSRSLWVTRKLLQIIVRIPSLLITYLLLIINESRFKVISWYNHAFFTYLCVICLPEKGLEWH